MVTNLQFPEITISESAGVKINTSIKENGSKRYLLSIAEWPHHCTGLISK
jgi:hypothetical protein